VWIVLKNFWISQRTWKILIDDLLLLYRMLFVQIGKAKRLPFLKIFDTFVQLLVHFFDNVFKLRVLTILFPMNFIWSTNSWHHNKAIILVLNSHKLLVFWYPGHYSILSVDRL
jgi:hypothetical protein